MKERNWRAVISGDVRCELCGALSKRFRVCRSCFCIWNLSGSTVEGIPHVRRHKE